MTFDTSTNRQAHSSGPGSHANSHALIISGAFATECRVLAPPPRARVLVEGVGLVSSVGKSMVRMDKQVDFTHPAAPQAGTVRITSMEGDTLHAQFDAQRVPHEAEQVDPFAGTFVVNGGTGRFANAVGELEFCGYTHFSRLGAVGAGLFSFKGTIRLE